MMSLPVWLSGPMYLLGVSVPGPMFLLGASVKEVSVKGGLCKKKGVSVKEVSVKGGFSVKGYGDPLSLTSSGSH